MLRGVIRRAELIARTCAPQQQSMQRRTVAGPGDSETNVQPASTASSAPPPVSRPIAGSAADERRRERIRKQIESLFWLLGAWFLITYSEFFKNVLTNPSRHSTFVILSALCLAGVTGLFLYLALFLPYVRGVNQDQWSTYCPWAIPTMTVLGLATGLFFIIGMWPVWGIITPVILFVIFMGFMMPCAHLVPNF